MDRIETDKLLLVLNVRQVVTLGFLGSTLVGVLLSGAYVAGRAVTAHQASRKVVEQKAPDQALAPAALPALSPGTVGFVRDGQPVSAGSAYGMPTEPPENRKPSPAPAPPRPAPGAALAQVPVSGRQTYLQVGSVNRGVAEVILDGLRRRGFEGIVWDGARDGSSRVLIGPYQNSSDLTKSKQALEEAGFSSFVRRLPPVPPEGGDLGGQ